MWLSLTFQGLVRAGASASSGNSGKFSFFLTFLLADFELSSTELLWRGEIHESLGEYEDTTSEKGRPGSYY
jgi:hypothetical protein